MEFEELQKIWNTQNGEPMYAINEAALRQRIQSYRRRTGRIADLNEVGLILISLLTGSVLLYEARIGQQTFSYLGVGSFVVVVGFVLWSRLQRKKVERRFELSMLGELDQTIANARHLVFLSKTFGWWFLLPAGLFAFPEMIIHQAPWYKWLLVLTSFVLSWLLVRFELRKVHLPRLARLETLKEKVLEEPEY